MISLNGGAIIILLAFLPFTVTYPIMSGPVALNVKFVLKPEASKAEFLAALKEDQQQTLAKEPGALQFAIGQDVNDPNIIHLHEQYKSDEDLQHHNSMPHLKDFLAYAMENDVFAADPVIDAYQCTHSPVEIAPRPAYCLNVESCIKPEFREEFLKLMASHQENSKNEAGCLQFDWGESAETDSSFYMHEEYVNEEGFRAHESSPHFEKFLIFNKQEPYSKPQVVSFFKTIV